MDVGPGACGRRGGPPRAKRMHRRGERPQLLTCLLGCLAHGLQCHLCLPLDSLLRGQAGGQHVERPPIGEEVPAEDEQQSDCQRTTDQEE